jgi:predicted nucleic acid-binding Zn ribbon protein
VAAPGRPRITPKARRRKEVAPAGVAIDDVLARNGLDEPLRAHRLITEWRDMVGERIAGRTWPDGLSKKVLWVRVANSAWLHELTLLKARLLASIHDALGEPRLVDDLRFHIGARKQVDADDALAGAAFALRTRKKATRLPLPPPAAGPALQRIERETANVDDDELRDLIRAVRVRHDR